MTDSATDRVRAAIASGSAPGRRDLEHSLRESFGMSARQAKRFASEGARGLRCAENPEAIDEDTEQRLRRLEAAMRL